MTIGDIGPDPEFDVDIAHAAEEVARTLPVPLRSRGNGESDPAHGSAANTSVVIYADTPDLPTITSLCWEAIVAANDPPRFFRHGGVLCRLEQDEMNRPVPIDLTRDRMRYELARIANWRK